MANEIEVVAPEGLFRNTNEEVEDPSIELYPTTTPLTRVLTVVLHNTR